jgi:hypothetical protein
MKSEIHGSCVKWSLVFAGCALFSAACLALSAATEPGYVTIPAGTQISVRTIDAIDSAKNHVGDRFQTSLQEPITVNLEVVVEKGADVYGRLAESKKSGTFTGRSELQLELTGIVVNGQTVPLVTGEYQLTGKSKGASTAKRTVGGAALGSGPSPAAVKVRRLAQAWVLEPALIRKSSSGAAR